MPHNTMPSPAEDPPTRWALAGATNGGYGEHFARLVADGQDIEGEARLADTLLPRSGRVLDVGSGMGRVAESLRLRGHQVVATEPDAALRRQSLSTYPDLAVLPHTALQLDPAASGRFDLVVAVGNVMIYLGAGTEPRVLARFRDLLAPGGRLLVGFHLTDVMAGSRHYPVEEFADDAAAAGLMIDYRFGSYELHSPSEDYAVWVLSSR